MVSAYAAGGVKIRNFVYVIKFTIQLVRFDDVGLVRFKITNKRTHFNKYSRYCKSLKFIFDVDKSSPLTVA